MHIEYIRIEVHRMRKMLVLNPFHVYIKPNSNMKLCTTIKVRKISHWGQLFTNNFFVIHYIVYSMRYIAHKPISVRKTFLNIYF